MSQDWKIFAQGITASIRTQNGQNLGGWLQLTGSKRRSQLAQLGGQLRGVDADQLVRSQPQLNDAVFGPVIAGMVAASIAISNGDFEAAYRNVKNSFAAFVDFFSSKESSNNWALPTLRVLSEDLKNTAVMAEQATKDAGCLRDAVNELSSRAFTNIYRDRTAITEPQSKRHGIFIIANTLFKLYFKMNTLQLCNKLIGNVESSKPMMDNLHLFPAIDIATYKYYVGRLKSFEDKYDEAREALRLALQLTPLSEVHNRQRILACLVPIEMTFGILPTMVLAQRYGFHEYYYLGQAVRMGDLGTFNELLEANRVALIHHGVYLVLEHVRNIVYRNLLRRIFLLQDQNTRINLLDVQEAFVAVQQRISLEEVECVVANLIYQGHIKGYISHKLKILVVSKDNAFPLSSIVTKV
eukprot:gene3612-2604_t